MLRTPFAIDEWFHCYGRGIEKRNTFRDKRDYERFLHLIYLANSERPIHRSNLRNPTLADVTAIKRGDPLVSIGAFCLMPNHFHLLVKEIREGGVSRFMQKLGTAYTMFFNLKYERTGGLFAKPFRSKHINEDIYFQWALQYVHCNPAELYEPKWKEGTVRNISSLESKLLSYPYGSFGAFVNEESPLRPLIDGAVFVVETQLPIKKMLREAQSFYAECVKATP
ncbi:MAG TPA: transposase [Candidatus Paceibacterota bacterium]